MYPIFHFLRMTYHIIRIRMTHINKTHKNEYKYASNHIRRRTFFLQLFLHSHYTLINATFTTSPSVSSLRSSKLHGLTHKYILVAFADVSNMIYLFLHLNYPTQYLLN